MIGSLVFFAACDIERETLFCVDTEEIDLKYIQNQFSYP